ncbi:unnamed protein product [Blepharisma stoltei]|uniref:Uncharacterized protein n=1 Tax=Blepharisma stoltei TaxID=1481888 RepID=A0AAU9JAU0_9CILI|nr:unnamed protein product [Blepharisma stoltei]
MKGIRYDFYISLWKRRICKNGLLIWLQMHFNREWACRQNRHNFKIQKSTNSGFSYKYNRNRLKSQSF